MEEDPQAPLVERVAEEEEVAPPQSRSDRDRHDDRDLGLREMVDVIVLADDEALPFALGSHVDAAVELEDHGAALERKAGVRVRDLDDLCRSVSADMDELAAIPAERDVRHDVVILLQLV